MGTTRRPKTELLSVKLSPRLAAKVAQLARQRQTTRSEIVREAVETLQSGAEKGSFLDLANRYCGGLRGPRDLSSNPKHLLDLGE
jgi:hypothetical protein